MSIYSIPEAGHGSDHYPGRNFRTGFPLPDRKRRMEAILTMAHIFNDCAGANVKGYRTTVVPVQQPGQVAFVRRAESISVERDVWLHGLSLGVTLECGSKDEAVAALDVLLQVEEKRR